MLDWNLYKECEFTDFINNPGFSLYDVLSICHRIITLKRRIEFKRVSFDKKVCYYK